MANSYLARTPSSTGNRKTFTFSAWVKRSKLLDNYPIMFKQVTDGSNFVQFYFDNQDQLAFYVENGSGSGYTSTQITNRKFSDVSAWYHVMVAVDTTQASADNRVKIYVNGNQETSFSTNTQINQNIDVAAINTTGLIEIGRASNNSSQHFNGYMSHVAMVDGQQLTPTSFGETDSTSGIWKFKSPSGLSWGTNGFHLKFENSGNLGLDSSGNGNNLTVSGDLRQALDTPSNNYATFNPIDGGLGDSEFTYGNNRFYSNTGSNVVYARSTLGFTSGKWYAEMKCETAADHNYLGITNRACPSTSTYFGDGTYEYGYKSSNGQLKNNTNQTAYGNTWTTNDIIGIAVDLDNNKLYFSKNGTWQNSGDPTSGSTGTGAISIASASTIAGSYGGDDAYFIVAADGTSSNAGRYQMNFGNGYFGTTAISSAGSNGNGSLFEYDVPTGFYALNTKNLNTYE